MLDRGQPYIRPMLIGLLVFRIFQPAGRTGSAASPPPVVRKELYVSLAYGVRCRGCVLYCTVPTVLRYYTARLYLPRQGCSALCWELRPPMTAKNLDECRVRNWRWGCTNHDAGFGRSRHPAGRFFCSLRISSKDTSLGNHQAQAPFLPFPTQLLTAPYSKIER